MSDSCILAYFLLVCVAALAGIGNVCFKKVALLPVPFYKKLIRPLFILGGSIFAVCPIVSSWCAKYIDFSVMYAMTSLNFLFILIFSKFLLHEPLDRNKIIGVMMIVAGLLVMVL